MVNYNPWPLKFDKSLQRVELEQIKEFYDYSDPRELVALFEFEVAEFAGSKYAVSTDCCTHAIELSFRLKMAMNEIQKGDRVYIPENTYVSVPMTLYKLGLKWTFTNEKWQGLYQIQCKGTPVFDGAVRWKRNMYQHGSLHCLSFQIKKRIPIGRGGMVLTDNPDFYEYLKMASYDGRDLLTPYDSKEHIRVLGYHYYMTPEDAARGLLLMRKIKEEGDSGTWENYPNLRQWLKEL